METTQNKWSKPNTDVAGIGALDIAFGVNALKYMPTWEEIPEDFQREYGEAKKWVNIVDDWFFNGIKITSCVMKEGIDRNTAMRQIQIIIGSFEPRHEHKTSAVAYLMSLWFGKFEYERAKE
jgi:hypothetical protein